MKNRELFAKDPLSLDLLNQGVSRVTNAKDPNEEKVARFELQTFVCDGQYATGLKRILRSFLAQLDKPEQAAAWVSGFYGSGKSHLVKMLRFLWTNHRFADGVTARSLINEMPAEVDDLLRELDTEAKRHGGLHAAAGTMGEGGMRHVRLSVLSILFRSLGLPGVFHQAKFLLWLKQNGHLDQVKSHLQSHGKNLETELPNLFVSPHLAEALVACDPTLPQNTAEVRKLLTAQFPARNTDVSNEEMLTAIRDALGDEKGLLPCTLLVLDEVQQFIAGDPQTTYQVQEMAEALSKNLDGRLLIVGTGQSALTDVPNLQRLLARFKVTVQLTDADVDSVIRTVLLQKRPDRTESLATLMEKCDGEISRQLAQSRIATRQEDRAYYVTDYPLLPVRRRFWERILRSVDSLGTNAQLRSQLDIVHQSNRSIADGEVGCVVACDFLYEQKAVEWQQTGVLPQEFHSVIMKLRQGGGSFGILKSRLCALMFLVSKVPVEANLGIEATPDTLTDLLTEDLRQDSAPLRQDVRRALEELVTTGAVSKVGEEYRLQTREGSEWERDFRLRYDQFRNNDAEISQARSDLLKEKVQEVIGSLKVLQGSAQVPRRVELFFGSQMPTPAAGIVPVWVRDGWTEQENIVLAEARQAGTSSAMSFLYLPKEHADELKNALAARKAAQEVLSHRGRPTSPEGQQAQLATETREREANLRLDNCVAGILLKAKVWLAGGQEQPGLDLRARVEDTARDAATRLFPQFSTADSDKWDRVLDRAKAGAADALKLIGFNADAHTHPVCTAVMAAIGVGKRGGEVIKHFEGNPYGWPVEAVCSALVLLGSSGHLRATQSGLPVEVRNLNIQGLRGAEFRCENITLTASQKIAIRQTFQKLGVPFEANREAEAAPACFRAIEQAALAASGEPPAPVRPNPAYVEQLRSLAGNDFLLALYQAREQIGQDIDAWKALAIKLQTRLPRWKTLGQLLSHARALPEADDLRQQAQAISTQRSLLTDPDPVTPLNAATVELLRGKLVVDHAKTQTLQAEQRATLEVSDAWQSLDPSQRATLAGRHGLDALPAVDVSSEPALLASLDAYDLSRWQMLVEALPQRFANAQQEAARLLEPEAVTVRLPSGTLHDEAEIEAWLHKVEVLLKQKLKEGPVLVS